VHALQITGNTLQQVDEFMYPRVVFTSDGRRNEENDTRIGKTYAFLREFYRSVVTKRELSNTQSRQFLNRSLFRSSLMVMNLR